MKSPLHRGRGSDHAAGMRDEFPKDHIEALWAPWRVEYFQAEHRSPEDFLLKAASGPDDEHLVVARIGTGFLIMNKYPYSAGHLMAVTNRKVGQMEELREEEIVDLWRLCILAQRMLRIAVRAQGFNVGWNIGKASGAGVGDHLHLHVVPRWQGDSNFIAVTGGTRIIPEGLRPLYERLVAIREELERGDAAVSV